MPPRQIADLILAVHEIALNALDHGGGQGEISCWEADDHLVIEIADRGAGMPDPLAGYIEPSLDADSRGLWLARLLSDLVEVRSTSQGTTVRLHLKLGA